SKVRYACQRHSVPSALAGREKYRCAVRLRAAKQVERMGQILEGEARLLCKAIRREIIGVSPSRRVRHFQKTFSHASLQVDVDERDSDPEFSRKSPLGLRALALHRL